MYGTLHDLLLSGTTNASGAATISAETGIFGLLYAVQWIDGTFADGVDGTLTYVTPDGVTVTVLTLTDANNDALYYPRHLVHSETGAALTGTSGGDRAMPLMNGKPILTIAQGGDTLTGGLRLYYFAR